MSKQSQFHAAINNGDTNLFKLFLAEGGVDIFFRSNVPLLKAIESNSIEIAKIILAHPRINLDERYSVIDTAAKFNRIELLSILLKDTRIQFYNTQHYAVIYACLYNYPEVLDMLIEDGRFNLSYDNDKAFHSAYKRKHYNIMETLWKHEEVRKSLKHTQPKIYEDFFNQKMKNKLEEF